MFDCNKRTTVSIFTQDKEWIENNIPDKIMPDKLHKLRKYYEETRGKPTWELMGEDVIKLIKNIAREEIQNDKRTSED